MKKNTYNKKILRNFIVLLLFTSCKLYAATISTTFLVSATILGTCLTVTALPLVFTASYDPTASSPFDQNTSLQVTCILNVPYTIALNAGTTNGGTISQRKMANGSNTLNYNLYTSAARTTIWGDGTTGSTVSGTGTGLLQTYTVYGRLPTGQNELPAGLYTDTVTVTVSY